MIFSGWDALGRVLVIGPLAYVMLVLFLRVSGKRTLTKLNAFDFVVTVALGSTLATTILSKSTSLSEGTLALALLIGLQFCITWLSARSERFQQLIKAEPTLLLHRGRILHTAMRAQRVTREELLAVLRARGTATPEAVLAVVLETNGDFSVLSQQTGAEPDTLVNLPRIQNDGTSADLHRDTPAT